LTAVPDAPASLRLTAVQRDAVTLSWEAPEADGGAPISGYLVERSDAARAGAGWATVGRVDASTFSFRVPKLIEANRYHFRVTAENAVGIGHPVETTHAVEVKSAFGQFCFFVSFIIIIIVVVGNFCCVVSEPAHLVSLQRTQHSIVVRPTAARAIYTDVIRQTIVQLCHAPDLELTAVLNCDFLYFQIQAYNSYVFYCCLLTARLTCSASASVDG